MFLFVFWLRNRASIKYLRNWRHGGASHKMLRYLASKTELTDVENKISDVSGLATASA